MSADIYYSYSGEAREREHWGEMHGTPEEIRAAAVMLYTSLRSQQESVGNEPTGSVWINNKPFVPTLEELETHDKMVEALLAREKQQRDDDAAFETDEQEEIDHGLIRQTIEYADSDDDDEYDLPEFTPVMQDDEDEELAAALDPLDFGFNSETDLEL